MQSFVLAHLEPRTNVTDVDLVIFDINTSDTVTLCLAKIEVAVSDCQRMR